MQTKVQLPRLRPNLLDRPGLRTRFVQALEAKRLVLLVAPAGFGKTALLVQALGHLPADMAHAWLRCDPDDDIQRFLGGLVEALDPLDLPWTVAPQTLGTIALQPEGVHAVAAELGHALASAEAKRGVLACDDLHNISDQRAFALLELLLDALPPGWCMVFASRSLPRMKLWRLWLQGAVDEFGQDDLRFTRDEVQKLLEVRPPDDRDALATPAADSAESLAEWLMLHTGGWIAGISLSLMASGGSTPTSKRLGRRRMFEYLASEVLASVPKEMRDFLVRCSLLPELSVHRCQALTGDPRCAAWLAEIDRAGLFVTAVEDQERTLKLHDLFRGFLEERLRAELAEEVPRLLERAAESEPDLLRRAEMLVQAGAWERVEDVLSHAAQTLTLPEVAEFVRMAERLPQSLRAASPSLAYMRGLAAWSLVLFEPMERDMAAAAAGFEQRQRPLLALRARTYLAHAIFGAGRVDEAVAVAQACRTHPLSDDREVSALCELLDLTASFLHAPAGGPTRHLRRLTDILLGAPAELWYRCMPMMTTFVYRPGFQPVLRRFLEEALIAAGESHLHLRASVQLFEAHDAIYGAIGSDASRARALLRRADEDMAWLALPLRRRLRFLRVYLVLLEGGRPTDMIREMVAEALALVPPLPMLLRNGVLLLVRQSANLGDWDTVRRMVTLTLKQGPFPEGPMARFPPQILHARLLLHDGDARQARDLLRPLMDDLSETERYGTEDYVRVALAAAEQRCGDTAAAWQALLPLIDGVASTGNTFRLVLAGTELLAELSAAPWGRVADARKLALLKGWITNLRDRPPAAADAPSASTGPAPAGPLEGLTRRELEVLERLAAGDSNKAIGRRLELSPNTVKRHVARILDRLAVDSRGEAANWYWRHHGASPRA
jgi:LuxR family maltose regulon positive regulatory protein